MTWRPTPEFENHYRHLAAELRQSGLSQKAFAKSRGIPSGTLSSALHALKQMDAVKTRRRGIKPQPPLAEPKPAPKKMTRPQPVDAQKELAPKMPSKPQFVPVRVAVAERPRPSGTYEIQLGRDRVLRLPPDFDDARVVALVRAVSSC